MRSGSDEILKQRARAWVADHGSHLDHKEQIMMPLTEKVRFGANMLKLCSNTVSVRQDIACSTRNVIHAM